MNESNITELIEKQTREIKLLSNYFIVMFLTGLNSQFNGRSSVATIYTNKLYVLFSMANLSSVDTRLPKRNLSSHLTLHCNYVDRDIAPFSYSPTLSHSHFNSYTIHIYLSPSFLYLPLLHFTLSFLLTNTAVSLPSYFLMNSSLFFFFFFHSSFILSQRQFSDREFIVVDFLFSQLCTMNFVCGVTFTINTC